MNYDLKFFTFLRSQFCRVTSNLCFQLWMSLPMDFKAILNVHILHRMHADYSLCVIHIDKTQMWRLKDQRPKGSTCELTTSLLCE